MIWFTADFHFGHRNIISLCNRPFGSVEEMNEILIENFNSLVKKNDTVYILGDISMKADVALDYLPKLNGNKIILIGNHDFRHMRTLRKHFSCHDIHVIKPNGRPIVLCHYPMRTWYNSHRGSWHAHGHCFDLQTEVLTKDGLWKTRTEINEEDKILTLNLETMKLEYGDILEIIDTEYSGPVYYFRDPNMRLTENHVLILQDEEGVFKLKASDIVKLPIEAEGREMNFISFGEMEKYEELDLSQEELRLFAWISSFHKTDITNKTFRVTNNIKNLTNLLEKLKIEFKISTENDTEIRFSHFPSKLLEFFSNKNYYQLQNIQKKSLNTLLNEYFIICGFFDNASVILKGLDKIICDLIQIACLKNGYNCEIKNINGKNYLIINTKVKSVFKQPINLLITNNSKEWFWCLRTPNQTIVTRRNGTGSVVIVGNSHGTLKPLPGQWDVGVDNNNFYPISYEELTKKLSKSKGGP